MINQSTRQRIHDAIVAAAAPTALPTPAVTKLKQAIYTAAVRPETSQDQIMAKIMDAYEDATEGRESLVGEFLVTLTEAARNAREVRA